MNRLKQLDFCNKCINRKKSSVGTTICGLTNKIAEFENNCLDFKEGQIRNKNNSNSNRKLKQSTWIFGLILFGFGLVRTIYNGLNDIRGIITLTTGIISLMTFIVIRQNRKFLLSKFSIILIILFLCGIGLIGIDKFDEGSYYAFGLPISTTSLIMWLTIYFDYENIGNLNFYKHYKFGIILLVMGFTFYFVLGINILGITMIISAIIQLILNRKNLH